MVRLNGLALAAVLLALVGCVKNTSNLTAPNAAAKETVFDGPPKAVAAAAQKALELMDATVVLNTENHMVRLVGNSANGTKFIMTFVNPKSGGGAKTVIHVDWVTQPDEALWREFMGNMMTALESEQRKAQQASR
jgi:hypothetical protein